MVVCHNRRFGLYNFSAYQPRGNRFPTLFLAIFSLLDRIKWIDQQKSSTRRNQGWSEAQNVSFSHPLFGGRGDDLSILSILPAKNVNAGNNLLQLRWYSISTTSIVLVINLWISPRQDVNYAIGQRILPTPFHIGSQRYVESFDTFVQDGQSKNCHKWSTNI